MFHASNGTATATDCSISSCNRGWNGCIEGLLKHSCDDYGWIEGRCTGSCRLNARLVHSEVID